MCYSPKAPAWSADEDSKLRDMWAAGSTADTIATALGGTRTRNAVLGRVNRLRRRDAPALPVRPAPPRYQPPEAYTAAQYVAGTSSGCFRCGAARPGGCTC